MSKPTVMTQVLQRARGEGWLQMRRFSAQVMGEPQARAQSSTAITVGSSRAADLRIDDPSVSRLHLRLEPTDKGVELVDLGSTNGTYIGGLRVLRALLAERTQISLGRASFCFELEDTFDEQALWAKPFFGELVGQSALMRGLFSTLERIAKSDATVLISGESGTGKELAAEAIHATSPRADRPFVVVDCGGLPATLIESELFGHERGAFSGAVSARAGAFEQADGGTLFLDEIGELELSLQSRLLRVVEAPTVTRIGSDKPIPINVRVIAATNRDLAAMVSSGDFREDLYFRLRVLPVRMPPLHEHPEDIELLARHFAQLATEKFQGARPDVLTAEIFGKLTQRTWPGNARELRNFVERATLLGPRARAGELPSSGEGRQGEASPSWTELPFNEARDVFNRDFERRYVEAALERSGGNVAAAARACGLSRGYLFRLIRVHGIERKP